MCVVSERNCMADSLLDKIRDKLKGLTGAKGFAAAAGAAFFVLYYFQTISCDQGPLACGGLSEIGIIFPLYALMLVFVSHIQLNVLSYSVLYILSTIVYTGALAFAVSEIEKFYQRYKNRPTITFKRI